MDMFLSINGLWGNLACMCYLSRSAVFLSLLQSHSLHQCSAQHLNLLD